ncbi:putative lipid II flippase FtsW [Crossiella cryophila]|uniref:Probable peptidoglycan glycosyltransferase FtsW n=1 Tax=Crossiella cryophila TaxID=43355 RepID=A0A7W7CBF5_9PSEU|nr:putative lipid II flippase FtsW [Crossiella cryophila]MBB4676801.1 cell division protein FtsW [Crossiella cryophila]
MPRRTRRTARVSWRSALTAWLSRPLADFHLVLAVFGLLTILGLVMVLSASIPDSLNKFNSSFVIFAKQLAYVCVGLVLFWIALRLPARTLRRLSIPAMVVSLLLLILVLVPGIGAELNKARSWFKIGPLSFQPVEPAKVALVLWGAHVLATKRAMLHQWRHLLVPLVPAALMMFALLMLQPDLGSTITLAVIVLSLLWFAGAPLRLFGVIALGAVTGAIVLAMTAAYRLERLTSFFNPDADPTASYQSKQALYALGDGGIFGVGLGQGKAKWSYLPNVHNDFIFAVVGEELGLIGAFLVLVLFGLLAYVGLRISQRNTDPWIRLVSSTLTVWLVAQAAINIGYVVGLLPVTGLTLPMISSGGTSAAVTMLVFGILANNARHEPEAVAALRTLGPGRVGKLLRLPAPEPYRPPAKRKPVRPSTPPRQAGRPVRAAAHQAASAQDDRRRTRRSTGSPDPRRRAGYPNSREGRIR